MDAKKVSTFQPRPSYRLQFPFVFRRLQSLQLLLPAHPCPPLSFPTFSGPSIPRLIAASFQLSDPRCFSILSSASVLGSDYSASVLPFLLFPVLPHSCFPGARFRSRFLGFPFLSGLISHAFLPGSCTRLYCSFPFALPVSLPQLFHRCLPSVFTSGIFRFPFAFFRPLSSKLPATQLSVFPFLLFPVLHNSFAFPVPVSSLASSVSPLSPA